MQSKIENIRDLKNVKLVLGNGFDLFCGLQTRYKDFFGSSVGKVKGIFQALDSAYQRIGNNFNGYKTAASYLFPPEFRKDNNSWDLLFSLSFSAQGDPLWCDVEQEMLGSLTQNDKLVDNMKPHWENVWAILEGNHSVPWTEESYLLASFVLGKHDGRFESKEEFYEFLLLELKQFEEEFARFIVRQHVTFDGFEARPNKAYLANAHSLLSSLCGINEISSIDCFNYGFTPEARFYEKCNFVNGDIFGPIFGVDSVFEPFDPRYIFTKTNRRIERDMNSAFTTKRCEFENAIVFGHSLSGHDFNYFFPLLDELEMLDFSSRRRIIFAFTIYDEAKQREIQLSVRRSIYTLFSSYAHYRGIENEPSRLLDSLTGQGRVMTLCVPSLPEGKKHVDANVVDFWPPDVRGIGLRDRWQRYLEVGKAWAPTNGKF